MDNRQKAQRLRFEQNKRKMDKEYLERLLLANYDQNVIQRREHGKPANWYQLHKLQAAFKMERISQQIRIKQDRSEIPKDRLAKKKIHTESSPQSKSSLSLQPRMTSVKGLDFEKHVKSVHFVNDSEMKNELAKLAINMQQKSGQPNSK